MAFLDTAPGLDDLLLDLVTAIELSDHDRKVADNRYARLKPHLERPSSPLRDALLNSTSLIYPQGSMAIGATIVSGTDDDRFDVDALVDMTVPWQWSDDDVLHKLYDALKGFPDVVKIIRCTRCVQLQFAFMHMDVTILDPAALPRDERVGEIFHSPDTGKASRIPSNPYGFGQWFRESVVKPTREFETALQARRSMYGIDRLPDSLRIAMDAEQEDLPPVIPPRLNAQQVLALKLMKRFINIRYELRPIRRPPSIYFSKLAVTCGYADGGLTAQLERFALKVRNEMDAALVLHAGPDERNPRHWPDRLNDRWPTTQLDRETLRDDMEHLLRALAKARDAEIPDIVRILSDLFGEKISRKTADTFMRRVDQSADRQSFRYEKSTGSIIPVVGTAAAVVSQKATAMPRHNFHNEG